MAVKEIGRVVKDGVMYQTMQVSATGYKYVYAAYAVDKGIEKLIIRSQIDGVPVTTISCGAFAQMPKLKKVIIEENFNISVEGAAFANCPRLEEIHSFAEHTSFGTEVFRECVCLKEVWATGDVLLMGQNIFEDCNKLQKLNADIAKVRDFAFARSGPIEKLFIAEDAIFAKHSLIGLNAQLLCFYGNVQFDTNADANMFQDFYIECRRWSNIADLAYEGVPVKFW